LTFVFNPSKNFQQVSVFQIFSITTFGLRFYVIDDENWQVRQIVHR